MIDLIVFQPHLLGQAGYWYVEKVHVRLHTIFPLPLMIKMHFSDNFALTANECVEPDQLFNSTISVLPGSNVSLTCSLVDTGVNWNSSWFAMRVRLDLTTMSMVESGIEFQAHTVSNILPLCSNATATITNIQESMDGLDITCYSIFPPGFTSTVLFDVIGKWTCVFLKKFRFRSTND